MLFWFKIFIIIGTTVLGILAVITDLKNEDTKKLKKAGYVYIVLFLMLTGLSFILENIEENAKEESTKKNFMSVINHTDTILTNTELKLNLQFDRISHLNTQIDSHLLNTAKNIQIQFNQTDISQKSIEHLIQKNKLLTEETLRNLDKTINSISTIDTHQRKSLSNLINLSEKTEKNLSKINQILDEVNILTEPLFPVQFVFKIKYKLDKPVFPNEIKYHYTREYVNDLIPLIEQENLEIGDYWLGEQTEIINLNEIRDSFCYNFYLKFFFFQDSLLENELVSYCTPQNSIDSIVCGFNFSSTISYEVHDTALIRESIITCNNISSNQSQIKNLSELTSGSYLVVQTMFEKLNSFNFIFQERNSNDKFQKYQSSVKIIKVEIEPYLEIRYGKNFMLSKIFNSQNIPFVDKYCQYKWCWPYDDFLHDSEDRSYFSLYMKLEQKSKPKE